MATRQSGDNKKIESVVLKVIKRYEQQSGKGAIEIRVVDWIVEGNHYPKLENREMFLDQEGEWRIGKSKGFSMKDLMVIQDNWGEIMTLMGNDNSDTGSRSTPPAMPSAPPVDRTAISQPSDSLFEREESPF